MSIPDNVIITDDINLQLNSKLSKMDFDKVAILVDENSMEHCLPLLSLDMAPEIIQINSGERNKNIETCIFLWDKLTTAGFTRKSIMINLGGGVIGDMGGFAASTYKRGIPFINIPTTLLSQVDASIGGKLGIDFHGLKNHIGIFREPEAILVDARFLATLSPKEIRSGYAEILKHGLIWNKQHWEDMSSMSFDPLMDWPNIIPTSISVKGEVVAEDPEEKGIRKILNFGHTLGHGIETHFLGSKDQLLHGEAIAAGMILESYLSYKVLELSQQELNSICTHIKKVYPKNKMPPIEELMQLIRQDKKNSKGKINFSLLSAIGRCEWDCQVPENFINESLIFYNDLYE